MAVNVTKVQFLTDKIVLLGHAIVDGHMFPNPSKLGKIGEFGTPTSLRAV